MQGANSVARGCLTNEWEQPVYEGCHSSCGQRRCEAPCESHMLEVTLPGAARMSEEQAVDQSGGHDWRCLVFEKLAFTMYPITHLAQEKQ